MQQETTVAENAQANESVEKRGLIYRLFAGYRTWRASIEAHPVWGVLLGGMLLLLGVAGSEAYGWARSKVVGPDEFLVQIEETQKREFDEIKKNLGQIRSSMDDAGRDAFDNVKNAVNALESTNNGLLQQIQLAKQENETLRKIVQDSKGISGGYDFILTEESGIKLDEVTTVGLQHVSSGTAAVNLSSAKNQSGNSSAYLHSGQSLSYVDAAGRNCRLVVMTVKSGRPGTASFSRSCA